MGSRRRGVLLAVGLVVPALGWAAPWGGTNGSDLGTPIEFGVGPRVAESYVVWAGGAPLRVYVRYVPQGPAAAPVAACGNGCDGQHTKPVAVVGNDNVLYVAWEASEATLGGVCPSGTCYGVYAQAFCLDGAALNAGWTAPQLLSSNLPPGQPKQALAIARVAGQGAFVAWEDGSGVSRQIAGRYVVSNNSCSAPAPTDSANIVLAPGGNGQQTGPDVASDGVGGVIVVWEDSRNGDHIYGQHVSSIADGVLLEWGNAGAPICLDGGSQLEPAITADGANGVIVAWRGTPGSGASGADDIFATHLCPGNGLLPLFHPGCAPTLTDTPVCIENGQQTYPVIVSDGAQGALIAWQDSRPLPGVEPSFALYCQRIGPDCMPPPPSGRAYWPTNGKLIQPHAVNIGSDYRPSITGDGENGAYLAWYNSTPDIYFERVGPGGQLGINPPTPLLCDNPPLSSNFQELPAVGFVNDGTMETIIAWFDNRQGEHVFGTRRPVLGEVAVGSVAHSQTMVEAWPNPFHRTISLRVTLPRRDEVALEVFDMIGRRIRTIARTRFEPGAYTFQWDGLDDRGVEGSTGIYFLRGRIGDRQFHRQLIRIR